jgi:hypothetical protein
LFKILICKTKRMHIWQTNPYSLSLLLRISALPEDGTNVPKQEEVVNDSMDLFVTFTFVWFCEWMFYDVLLFAKCKECDCRYLPGHAQRRLEIWTSSHAERKLSAK